jgi:hypothetical protein
LGTSGVLSFIGAAIPKVHSFSEQTVWRVREERKERFRGVWDLCRSRPHCHLSEAEVISWIDMKF